jgi:hypothetical protein
MKKTTLSTITLLILIIVFTLSVKQVIAESPIIGKNSDGTVEIQIHSFDTATSLDSYTPSIVGYIFTWVDLSIKNIGTQEVSTNQIHAYLKDSQNYQYTSRIVGGSRCITVVHLSPGEALRGEIYWEIPSDAEITSFIWDDDPIYITIPAPSPKPTESPDIPEFPLTVGVMLVVTAVTVLALVLKRKR